MKKLLAVAVLASTTVASAASDRNIYDIMYLPNAGTTYGLSDFSYAKLTVDAKNNTGSSKTKGWDFTQTIGHSFTDRLSIQATMDYTSLTTDPNASGAKSTDTTGISDPTLTARFRVMDEDIRLDIVGGALFSLGDNKTKSNGDSNNYQGGSDAFLGAQVGNKGENFQWAVLGQYTQYMKATNKDSSPGGVNSKDDSHGQWLLRGDILDKLAERSFLRTHVQATFTPDYDDNQKPAGTTPSSTVYEIGTQYQHLFSQDLLVRAGIDYDRFNTMSGQIDRFDAWKYTIGATYQF